MLDMARTTENTNIGNAGAVTYGAASSPQLICFRFFTGVSRSAAANSFIKSNTYVYIYIYIIFFYYDFRIQRKSSQRCLTKAWWWKTGPLATRVPRECHASATREIQNTKTKSWVGGPHTKVPTQRSPYNGPHIMRVLEPPVMKTNRNPMKINRKSMKINRISMKFLENQI